METFSMLFGMLCGACLVPLFIWAWLSWCRIYELPKRKRNLGLVIILAPFVFVSLVMGKRMFLDEPLIQAAADGKLGDVQRLLAWRADPNATLESANTPLCFATFNGHEDVAIYLVEHGADPQHVCEDGWRPLQIAKQRNRIKLARFLESKEKPFR